MFNIEEVMSVILSVMAVLVFTTTIVVGVLKTFIKIPTSYLAVIVAMVITLLAFFAFMSYKHIAMQWFYVVGAIVLGIFVAYVSMFGFDKFKEAWESAHSYKYKK